MVSIDRPSDTGSRSTDVTAFIQCIDGQKPQIHELWRLDLDNISCGVHPTAQVEVTTGTVGKFVTDYLSENGLRTQIIGKISVNNSVQFWKPNCNLCMQERLIILKELRDKRFIVMNKNYGIYGACRHKTTFHQFCLSTDDPVFNG